MSSALAAHWLVRALGWAIVHSLWQGAIIAILVAVLLRALARSSATVRYVIACAGLVAMAASFAFTSVRHVPVAPAAPDVTLVATTDDLIAVANTPATAADDDIPSRVTDATVASWGSRLDAWSGAIVLAWLLGVSLLSARVAFGWYQVQCLRAAAHQGVPDMLLERGRAIGARLGVSRPFRIAQSAVVQVPTVIGWLRPIVLLPVSALAGMPAGQLDAIVAHELAHIRRHDYVVNIVQTAIEVLLFYHPACWWISRQIRSEREHCCDDLVVAVCGDPVEYATALAELETLRCRTPSLSLAATDGLLLRRVRRLLTRTAADDSGPSWVAAAVPIAILTVALTGVNAAQSTTPGAARTVPATEAVMQGQIVDASSGRPLRSVTVELIGPVRTITVATGDDGKYEVSGLEPGKYRISATLTGYVTAHFGQRNRNDIGVLAEVSGGRFTSGIDLRMQAAAGINGRVLDERGEGVSGVEVELVSRISNPGITGPVAVGFAQTVEGGEFEFKEVLPGDYWVRAYMTPREGPRDSGQPGARSLRALADAHNAFAAGLSPGTGYRSSFFPGVTRLEEAQPLHVDSGAAIFGIDFALVAAPTHRVTGRVLDESGRPVTDVRLQFHSMGGVNSSHAEYSSGVDRNGRFDIHEVASGDYMMMVLDKAAPWRWTGAVREITVDDEDVTDLDIRAAGLAHVEGRVIRESSVTRPLDPSGIRVLFERRVSGGGRFIGGGRPVNADGTFSFEAATGPVTVAVADVPKGWMVRRVLVDDVEVDERPLDLGAGARRHIDILLTDRVTQLLGAVGDAKGRPMMGAEVLVFPEGATSWMPGERSIRQVRADAFGRFRLDGLPPGDYLAVAVDRPAPFLMEDAIAIQRLSSVATRLKIVDGDRHVITLRVTALSSAVSQ